MSALVGTAPKGVPYFDMFLDTTLAPTPAHPPSDGAHRLAWWLAEGGAGVAALQAAVGAGTIERLLSGELEPGEELAAELAIGTAGAVRVDDWRRGGPLGWTERPFRRD